MTEIIPFVKPQKALQTNREKLSDGSTHMRTPEEMIAWVDTLDPNEYVAEIKENGHRAEFQRAGWWTTRPTWEDRGRYQHICGAIPEGCVLDGELRPIEGEGHEKVNHLRASAPEKLKFVVFDILCWRGQSVMDRMWETRRRALESLYYSVLMNESNSICLSQTFFGKFGEHLRTVLDHKREGLILKKRDKPYKPGSRCSDWLKAKGTETVDAVITGCDGKPTEWRVRPGQTGKDGVYYPDGRKTSSHLAGFVGLEYGFHDARTGELKTVGTLGMTGPREKMKKYGGRGAELLSFGSQTPDGCLQHPTFKNWREDRDPRVCVFDFGG